MLVDCNWDFNPSLWFVIPAPLSQEHCGTVFRYKLSKVNLRYKCLCKCFKSFDEKFVIRINVTLFKHKHMFQQSSSRQLQFKNVDENLGDAKLLETTCSKPIFESHCTLVDINFSYFFLMQQPSTTYASSGISPGSTDICCNSKPEKQAQTKKRKSEFAVIRIETNGYKHQERSISCGMNHA